MSDSMSISVGYLMPKPYLNKNSSSNIKHIALGWGSYISEGNYSESEYKSN